MKYEYSLAEIKEIFNSIQPDVREGELVRLGRIAEKVMPSIISEIEKLKAEQDAHNALRERLRELEWCGVPGNDICYVCCGDRKHSEDCWLGNALKDSK